MVDYQITLINTGTAGLTGILTDILPTQLTYANSSPLASLIGLTPTWTGIFVPASGSRQFVVRAVLNGYYASGTLYTNNADFSCQSPTACTVVDNALATGVILGLPNLALVKTLLV